MGVGPTMKMIDTHESWITHLVSQGLKITRFMKYHILKIINFN